jgi:hypothetical protein
MSGEETRKQKRRTSWKRSLGALQAGGQEGAKMKAAVETERFHERRQINARCELNQRLGVWTPRLSASRMKSGRRALTHCGQKIQDRYRDSRAKNLNKKLPLDSGGEASTQSSFSLGVSRNQ